MTEASGRPPQPLAGGLARFRARYGRLLEWVVGALMVLLFVEVTVGVVFRALGHALIWYDEVASIMLAWLTYYGAALGSVRRAHISCPELVDALPWGMRRALNIVAQGIVIAFFVILAYVGVSIMPVLAGDTLPSLPWMPQNFVMSVVPVSAVLIVIAEAAYLIELVASRAPPASAGGVALADGLH